MPWFGMLPAILALEDRVIPDTLNLESMAYATPVKRTDAGTSLTKAAMCFGLRQQQQCASIWVSKHAPAGCLT